MAYKKYESKLKKDNLKNYILRFSVTEKQVKLFEEKLKKDKLKQSEVLRELVKIYIEN